MRIMILSFTEQGSKCNAKLKSRLEKQGYLCKGYAAERFARPLGLLPLEPDLKEWIGTWWGRAAFLFIGAVGIAVRMTAPWIRDKYQDSAVISMDEKGQFVIPVLSGHVGGGVELARRIAFCMQAVPVITTATDVQGKFAVDVFAGKRGLRIQNRDTAKRISAAVLEQERIGFYSSFPVHGELPAELEKCKTRKQLLEYSYGIAVDGDVEAEENDRILHLVPRTLVAGIGCRKGISCRKLRAGLEGVLREHGKGLEQVCAIASIDLKAEEPGILQLAGQMEVPFLTYSAEVLEQVSEVSSGSAFVKQVTGVDNICERAAKVCCPGGRLLQPKIRMEGMTAAIVEQEWEIWF